MPMVGLGISKRHVMHETGGLFGVAIGSVDQRVGLVSFDILDEGGDCLRGNFELVRLHLKSDRKNHESLSLTSGPPTLKWLPDACLCQLLQAIEIEGPDIIL